ncbi:hypothetical protein UFOVP323_24 [uncultured Caudovirales phage]|uniref:Uncharacterized protein n=1 Tax=uncultured Caudovirales phage TaxID=2100421 RepID=A0A6J5LTB2_9CAUD|nr:hypothetical protein UFOVP323_24 [uncultured Caudovirales phage]
MSTLTGQAIKDTYEGLLKLDDSTNGITSSFQQIQDGLGNDTGLRIRQNQLQGAGLFSYIPLTPQFMGGGINLSAGNQFAAGTQNILQASAFYDSGVYSYSAMTMYLGTATSTTDTCEAAIYSAQYINGAGLHPRDVIISGLTIPTTGSVGLRTITFPSNISMSGSGAGVYFVVFKVSNGGVQPTFRPGSLTLGLPNVQIAYGPALNLAGTLIASPVRTNATNIVYSGTSTFQNPFPTSIASTQSTTASIAGNSFGQTLHVVGA